MMRSNAEHEHQAALFEWAAMAAQKHPELRLMYAIPNGGARTARTGAMLKREGVKAGVPDICLPVAKRGFSALYIELKAPGGRLSDVQRQWQAMLTAHGNAAHVCVGWHEARECILFYLTGGCDE